MVKFPGLGYRGFYALRMETKMTEHVKVVVIGGGVVGCSALYHLAALGIKDALLLLSLIHI